LNEKVYYLGIDLGGTKIAAGVLQDVERVLSFVEQPTEAYSSREKILANIETTSKMAVAEAGIDLTDLSFAGLAIPACPEEHGELLPECPNLPKLGRVRIRSILTKRLGCKVALENDANCFVLGGWLGGVARNRMNVAGVTLGTGLGVGLILNGKLYRGRNWQAGEIWDQPMPSGGIVEDGISGRRLARDAGVASGKKVVQLAQEGDLKAREVLISYGRNVGWLLSFIGRLLDPELFVVGGSVAKAFHLYKEEVNAFVKGHWEIQISKLGPCASVIGAAMLCRHPYPVSLNDLDTRMV